MTVGPVGGADPEAVDESDLIISWGADLVATNVHFWAKAEAAQKRGVKIVVIDPRKSRTARACRLAPADPDRHRRGIGARDHAHPGARWARRPRLHRGQDGRLRPARSGGVAEISARAGCRDHRVSPRAISSGWRRLYGAAKRSFIRLGEGMTRLARGGEALRAVALLPGVTGAYGTARRRRAAADGCGLWLELRRAPQTFRAGSDTARSTICGSATRC